LSFLEIGCGFFQDNKEKDKRIVRIVSFFMFV
jgi:hypothetical protein